MDKADIAILVSLVAAVGSVSSAIYTGRIARNDQKRMERTAPVLELVESEVSSIFPGLTDYLVKIRNLEQVGVKLVAIRAQPRHARIGDRKTYTTTNDFGEKVVPVPVDLDQLDRKVLLGFDLKPFGTPTPKLMTGDACMVQLIGNGISGPRDLRLEWEWLDRQKA